MCLFEALHISWVRLLGIQSSTAIYLQQEVYPADGSLSSDRLRQACVYFVAASQVSTRLITFFLNLLTARLLTVDAYGVRLGPKSFCLTKPAWSTTTNNMCLQVFSAILKVLSVSRPIYGWLYVQLASIQFHLINTTILFLSREGLRRGCLRAQQIEDASGTKTILSIAALCIPLGAVITGCVCAVALKGSASILDPYETAVLLQGMPVPLAQDL